MTDNSKPAFPVVAPDGKGQFGCEGMTLREYAAIHAPINLEDAIRFSRAYGNTEAPALDILAEMAVGYADKLLEELKK